jgi:hypothetical protein
LGLPSEDITLKQNVVADMAQFQIIEPSPLCPEQPVASLSVILAN